MDFGQRGAFAIEVYLDQLDRERQWAFGRMRCWIGGSPLGVIEMPQCMLNVTANFLRVKLRTLNDLTNATLGSLTNRMAFKCLDQALYTEGIEPVDDPDGENFDYRYDFLTNGGESFDGTKSFIIRADQQLRILFDNGDGTIQSAMIDQTEFESTVSAFLDWLDGELGD